MNNNPTTPIRNDDDIRKLFESASQQVSLNTYYRLEQASRAALQAGASGSVTLRDRDSVWSHVRWALGGGAVAAAVTAVALMFPQFQTTDQVAVTAPVAAPTQQRVMQGADVKLVDDSTAWDEDPTFYAWLTSAEAQAVAIK